MRPQYDAWVGVAQTRSVEEGGRVNRACTAACRRCGVVGEARSPNSHSHARGGGYGVPR